MKLATAFVASIVVSAQAAGAGITGYAGSAVSVPILVYHHFGAKARDEMAVRTQTFAWQLHHLD